MSKSWILLQVGSSLQASLISMITAFCGLHVWWLSIAQQVQATAWLFVAEFAGDRLPDQTGFEGGAGFTLLAVEW